MYKALDRDTGKIVALKKVRFDTAEPESIKFMAREIIVLQKMDHPNVIKLEGLATSRMQYSLYLVFEFMLSDLTKVISRPEGRLTEPQVCLSNFDVFSCLAYFCSFLCQFIVVVMFKCSRNLKNLKCIRKAKKKRRPNHPV